MGERDDRPVPPAVVAAAADWWAKRDRGLDAASEDLFRRWRDASPVHRRAYEQIEARWRAAAELDGSGTGRTRALGSAPFYLRRDARAGIAAASLAVVGATGLMLVPERWRPNVISSPAQAQVFQTTVGEIRTVSLKDGSHVTLDTDTRVEVSVSPTQRHAKLDRGRARFAVARSETPFLVSVNAGTITANAATFDVAAQERLASVHVFRGDVQIEEESSLSVPKPAAALGSGQQAVLGNPAPSAGLPSTDDGWPQGMIALDATPIAAAIADINRYNRVKIRLDASDVGGRTMSGAFKARDPDGFAQAIAALHSLRLTRPTPDLIVLASRR